MKSTYSRTACCISTVVALTITVTQCAHAARLPQVLAAQQGAASPTPPPPPARIASAHSIFLTNAGADPNFPIDSAQSYNDIYSALQSWGHFQLVSSADDADLVFELREVAPVTGVSGIRGTVDSYTSPAFQLSIRDPKTNAVLWTITSPVELSGRRKEMAHWITLSEMNLISRVKAVAGISLTATENQDLTTVPKTHAGRNVLLVLGLTVGAGLAGGLILHHEYENGIASQKATQDAFCTANHIPLSECAGG